MSTNRRAPTPTARRKNLWTLILLAIGTTTRLAGEPGGTEAMERVGEYEVKAAFLYNFVRFVEWPARAFAAPGSPVVIGILGDDPFGAVLERTIEGQTVSGRPLVARRLADLDEIARCNMVFISSSETHRLEAILALARNAAVLTVGEVDGFAAEGGVIGFRTEKRRIRFDINVMAAEASRLRLSSQLLKLARIVKTAGREEPCP